MRRAPSRWRIGGRRSLAKFSHKAMPEKIDESNPLTTIEPKKYTLIRVIGFMLLFAKSSYSAVAAQPPTAEQAVARCAAALGGSEKIAAITTLRLKVTYPGKTQVYITEIKRPNRIRSEADYILVFNGTRAGFLKGAPAVNGKDPGPQLVGAESWQDFEIDLAFVFPVLFDYPATYLGSETVEGKKFHKLQVTLPLGTKMTYLLDAKTFLPIKMIADVPYGGAISHPERIVGDYQETAGVLFPRSFTSTDWGEKGHATVTSVEVNILLDDTRFEMPNGF